MTLGRTSSNAINIKTDEEGGGLRAVNCACCGGCNCVFNDGDIVKISAFGKDSVVTMGQTSHGPVPCYGDIGDQFDDQVDIRFITQYIGIDCEVMFQVSDFPDFFWRYRWRYSIQGCFCRIDFDENTNISDAYISINAEPCISPGNPPGCCVCNDTYSTNTVTHQYSTIFPIKGYGTYNVQIPLTELYFPSCNPYSTNSTPSISVVLSEP